MDKYQECTNRLLEYSRYLCSDHNDIVGRTLEGINRFFGFKSAVWVSLEKKHRKIIPFSARSFTIYSDEMPFYKANFFQNHAYMNLSEHMLNQDLSEYSFVLKATDAAQQKLFRESPYGNALAQYNIMYEAVIVAHQVNSNLIYTISVFKTYAEGDFTEDELWLLNCIGSQLIISMTHHAKKTDQKMLRQFMLRYIPDAEVGICVVNKKFKRLVNNPIFDIYWENLFENRSLMEGIQELIPYSDVSALWPRQEIEQPYENASGKYEILIYTDVLDLENNLSREYLMLKIRQISSAAKRNALNMDDATTRYYVLFEEYNLSRRELDVLRLVVQGMDNAQIANELYLSVATVKTHIRNLFGKIGVQNRTALIAKFHLLDK